MPFRNIYFRNSEEKYLFRLHLVSPIKWEHSSYDPHNFRETMMT